MTLEALAADMGYPRVVFSKHLTIEGENGWLRVLGHSPAPVPAEERRLFMLLLAHAGIVMEDPLPSWVCPELVVTAAARARLRDWIQAGSVAPTADDLVRRLRYVGDGEVRDVLLGALLEDVAPPAAAYVLEYLFVGSGWSTRGWCSTVANPGGPLLRIVNLCGASHDPATIRDVALHEVAHGFTLENPTRPSRAEEVFNGQAALLLAAAKSPDRMRDLLRDEARLERAADDLAATWGGRLRCSADRTTEHSKLEAARLAAVYLS